MEDSLALAWKSIATVLKQTSQKRKGDLKVLNELPLGVYVC